MDPKKRRFLAEVLGEDKARELVEQAETKTAELERLGVRHKALKSRTKDMPMMMAAAPGPRPLSFSELDRQQKLGELGPDLLAVVANVVYSLEDGVIEPDTALAALRQAVSDFASRLQREKAKSGAKATSSPVSAYVGQLAGVAAGTKELVNVEKELLRTADRLTGPVVRYALGGLLAAGRLTP